MRVCLRHRHKTQRHADIVGTGDHVECCKPLSSPTVLPTRILLSTLDATYTNTRANWPRGRHMTGVAELEAQLAFVEDTVSALDSALAAQQQHIMKLEQELELLRARLIEQGTRLDEITPAEAEPPPPHY